MRVREVGIAGLPDGLRSRTRCAPTGPRVELPALVQERISCATAEPRAAAPCGSAVEHEMPSYNDVDT